jgi:hypothetical protein
MQNPFVNLYMEEIKAPIITWLVFVSFMVGVITYQKHHQKPEVSRPVISMQKCRDSLQNQIKIDSLTDKIDSLESEVTNYQYKFVRYQLSYEYLKKTDTTAAKSFNKFYTEETNLLRY